jgi:hypothetical protein
MPQANDEQDAASSTANDETTSASSTEEAARSSEKEPTMLEVARAAARDSLAREGAESETSVEGPVLEKDKTETEEEGSQEEEHPENKETETEEKSESEGQEKSEGETEEEEDEEEEDADKNVPFAEHPHWKKRVKEFNAMKAENETLKAKQRTPEVDEAVQKWTYHKSTLDEYGVTQEEADYMLSIACAFRANPGQARQMLAPLWDKLKDLDENALPADLQEAVNREEITEAMAKRLWAAEVKNRTAGQSGQFAARKQQQDAQKAVNDAIASWESHKRKTDPDYRPKAKGGKDGLWEFVADRFMRLFALQPPKNGAEQVRLLEQAYTEVKETYGSRVRSFTNGHRKNLTSKRSIPNSSRITVPKSVDEAVKKELAEKHGISWAGRQAPED